MTEYIHEEFGRQSLDDAHFEPEYVPFEDEPEQPTWTKVCACGATVERWRGESEVTCDGCGREWNAFGQELRADWRGNPSWHDDDIDDLEGMERQYANDE